MCGKNPPQTSSRSLSARLKSHLVTSSQQEQQKSHGPRVTRWDLKAAQSMLLSTVNCFSLHRLILIFFVCVCIRTDLDGAIFGYNSMRLALGVFATRIVFSKSDVHLHNSCTQHEKCRRILIHVLKPYDIRSHNLVPRGHIPFGQHQEWCRGVSFPLTLNAPGLWE